MSTSLEANLGWDVNQQMTNLALLLGPLLTNYCSLMAEPRLGGMLEKLGEESCPRTVP